MSREAFTWTDCKTGRVAKTVMVETDDAVREKEHRQSHRRSVIALRLRRQLDLVPGLDDRIEAIIGKDDDEAERDSMSYATDRLEDSIYQSDTH